MKKICYTAIIGDYDTLFPVKENSDWVFVCITDQNIKCEGWNIERIKRNVHLSPERQARYYKAIVPFKNNMPILWIDARFRIIGDLNELLKGVKSDIAVAKHPVRTNISQEADEVVMLGLSDNKIVRSQVKRYVDEFGNFNGLLPACGLLYRKEPTPEFNSLWWNEILHGSHRDQLSFNYAAKKTGVSYEFLKYGIYDRRNPFFYLGKHNIKRRKIA